MEAVKLLLLKLALAFVFGCEPWQFGIRESQLPSGWRQESIYFDVFGGVEEMPGMWGEIGRDRVDEVWIYARFRRSGADVFDAVGGSITLKWGYRR